jgi:hypothetical protein
MVQKVDPFVYPIPKKILADPELRPYFEYFHRWAHDMWRRTGGSSDDVADTGLRETYPWLQELNSDDQQQNIYNVENITNQEVSYSVETPINKLITKTISNEIYTAVDNMFIKSKLGSTIKLPTNPANDCVIYAHNGDGTLLTIDGNGKKINGHDKLFIRQKGNGLQIYYFIEDNEYIAI